MMWIPLVTGETFMEIPVSVTRGIAMPHMIDTQMISAQVRMLHFIVVVYISKCDLYFNIFQCIQASLTVIFEKKILYRLEL